MSATATLISAVHALQGAQIDARPPDQLIVYINKTGIAPVMTVIFTTDFINDAADQGDIVLGATLTIDSRDASYAYDGLARLLPRSNVSSCSFGASCAPVNGFLIETVAQNMVEIPKGSARTFMFSFPLDSSNCVGRQCKDYASLARNLASINSGRIMFKEQILLHGDGKRMITCTVRKLDAKYLMVNGFTSIACQSSKVFGNSLFS